MVRDTGFEPVTPSVSGRCSTTELTALGLSPHRLRACILGEAGSGATGFPLEMKFFLFFSAH